MQVQQIFECEDIDERKKVVEVIMRRPQRLPIAVSWEITSEFSIPIVAYQ